MSGRSRSLRPSTGREVRRVEHSERGRLECRAAARRLGASGSAAQAGARRGPVRGWRDSPPALADLGLIDEYEFVVQPVLAGHGPTLLAGLRERIQLELVDRHEFRDGGGRPARPATRSDGRRDLSWHVGRCLATERRVGARGVGAINCRRVGDGSEPSGRLRDRTWGVRLSVPRPPGAADHSAAVGRPDAAIDPVPASVPIAEFGSARRRRSGRPPHRPPPDPNIRKVRCEPPRLRNDAPAARRRLRWARVWRHGRWQSVAALFGVALSWRRTRSVNLCLRQLNDSDCGHRADANQPADACRRGPRMLWWCCSTMSGSGHQGRSAGRCARSSTNRLAAPRARAVRASRTCRNRRDHR